MIPEITDLSRQAWVYLVYKLEGKRLPPGVRVYMVGWRVYISLLDRGHEYTFQLTQDDGLIFMGKDLK